jgi:sulfite oxidase
MTPYGKRSDTTVHEREPFNAEPSRAALAENSVTPLDAFYVRGHGAVPEIDAAAWRLRVGGLVERELELGLDDLRGLPHIELPVTLQCAGNRRADLITVRDIPGEAPWGPGATGTAVWGGVSLADVIAQAAPEENARFVGFEGADRSREIDPPELYGSSIPIHKAREPETLLAWSMNGEPLPAVHGGPVRAVVPGYIGARSVKWLRRVELRSEPWHGYFQSTAYRLLPPGVEPGYGVGMELGKVAVNSDVLVPPDGAVVAAGQLEARGYAFAGGRRQVERVDVSLDGGREWRQAELLEDLGPWAWRLWRMDLELEPGDHEIVVRAWDSAAGTQPEDPAGSWNPKGYANNSWGRARVTAV